MITADWLNGNEAQNVQTKLIGRDLAIDRRCVMGGGLLLAALLLGCTPRLEALLVELGLGLRDTGGLLAGGLRRLRLGLLRRGGRGGADRGGERG